MQEGGNYDDQDGKRGWEGEINNRPVYLLFGLLTVLLICLATPVAWAPPAPPPRYVPGSHLGEVRTRWLGPYVSVTEVHVGIYESSEGTISTTVRWFYTHGKVIRELSGPNVNAHGGYVAVYEQGMTTIHGVCEDWRFVLPRKAGVSGHITATSDSHTFVHQYDPQPGQLMVDIYKSGELVATVGPFLDYKGHDFRLAEDGSMALPCWHTPEKRTAQTVVLGPDGVVRFQVVCGEAEDVSRPAHDGHGVLVKYRGDIFTFYDGIIISPGLVIGPNPHFMGWLPRTTKALFSTSVGHESRYQVIDWPAAKVLWDIPDPNPKRYHSSPAIAWAGDYVLFSSLEFMKLGEREGPVRTIYAVDVNTGEVVAQWLPKPLCHFYLSAGGFRELGDKLYYIADEAFTQINPDDIAARVNGWRDPVPHS